LSALGILSSATKSNDALWLRVDAVLDEASEDQNPIVRVWSARFTSERAVLSVAARRRLLTLAADDDVTVRAAAAVAERQFVSGSLTADLAPSGPPDSGSDAGIFKLFLAKPSRDGDFYYPHIVWMAIEPRMAQDPQPFFPLLAENENSVSAYCLRRVMRRICDLTDPTARQRHLNAAMSFLGSLASRPALAEAALDGLIDAFKSKGQPPSINVEPVFARLTANPALADKARELATLLGDTSASRALIARINDTHPSIEDRLKGIQAALETADDTSKTELLRLLTAPRTRPSGTLSAAEGEKGLAN